MTKRIKRILSAFNGKKRLKSSDFCKGQEDFFCAENKTFALRHANFIYKNRFLLKIISVFFKQEIIRLASLHQHKY